VKIYARNCFESAVVPDVKHSPHKKSFDKCDSSSSDGCQFVYQRNSSRLFSVFFVVGST